MKKLRLDSDSLAVETFPVERTRAARGGTVHAHDSEGCGDTPNGVCLGPTTYCYPSQDKSWCGCDSVWCATD